MASRSDHSRDELREMALNAAEKMIEMEGLKGLSARKVAAEMGYAVGTLYLVFKNIDALIMAVNVRTLEQMEAQLCTVSAHDDPAHSIAAMAKAYIQYAVLCTPRWRAVFEHHLPAGEVLSEAYEDVAIRLLQGVEKPLAMLRPNADDEAVRIEARALWASVHGLCSLTVGEKLNRVRAVDPTAVIDVLIQRFVAFRGEPS